MRIFPLGDSAATIEFGNEISVELNEKSIALTNHLTGAPFDGMVEAVPAYASVTVYYEARKTSFTNVESFLNDASQKIDIGRQAKSRLIEIPIEISPEASPDLGRIAEFSGLDAETVIELFLSTTYRIYMLGFLPGFAYMGGVDDRIAAPRLETPRTKVPAGSVGIAGKQTGIYPLESPGGWNIIGRTDLKMFDPTADQPCLLKPGDEVRFVRC
ncbi:MAG TPA: 5-oxoprolinase subunit PxpB [Pyrinomonadaceae bacterium]